MTHSTEVFRSALDQWLAVEEIKGTVDLILSKETTQALDQVMGKSAKRSVVLVKLLQQDVPLNGEARELDELLRTLRRLRRSTDD